VFGDYQTARLMQASSSYPTDLHGYFVGIPQGLPPIIFNELMWLTQLFSA